MLEESGEIKTYNSAQGIARERDLKLILWHTEAMRQARTGDVPNKDFNELSDNDIKMNQVRGLNLIISAQEELISTFRSQIKFRSLQKWKKSHRSDEDREKNKFNDFECDYKTLMFISEKLSACRMDILEAERTKKLDDDFVIEKQDNRGEVIFELTRNFYEMLKELENTFEEIHLLLLVNKCISAGIEEDEEMTYKQKEEEAVKRVVEA